VVAHEPTVGAGPLPERTGERDRSAGRSPMLGRRYRLPPAPGVCRLLLRATRYHLYYLVAKDEIAILAVWYGGRGGRPPLSVPE
jgi:hypothetical protein